MAVFWEHKYSWLLLFSCVYPLTQYVPANFLVLVLDTSTLFELNLQ